MRAAAVRDGVPCSCMSSVNGLNAASRSSTGLATSCSVTISGAERDEAIGTALLGRARLRSATGDGSRITIVLSASKISLILSLALLVRVGGVGVRLPLTLALRFPALLEKIPDVQV